MVDLPKTQHPLRGCWRQTLEIDISGVEGLLRHCRCVRQQSYDRPGRWPTPPDGFAQYQNRIGAVASEDSSGHGGRYRTERCQRGDRSFEIETAGELENGCFVQCAALPHLSDTRFGCGIVLCCCVG